jgi:pimeloyl-ACP methyl ester carboxylesterase
MSSQRTHYVTTPDGVTLGGTVHGDGPPLVFLQGVIGDGDLDWSSTVGHLTDKFTCHLPSLRGRGLSSDHPNLGGPRLAEDFLTYVDSLGEPTGLTGWSGGGAWALAVAAQSDAVSAVAPFEPGILSLADEQVQADIGNAVARTGELAAEGNLAAAARALAGFPFNDDEIAVAADAGYFEAAGRYVPNLLNLLQQAMGTEDPFADPAMLAAIRAPVVVLLGSDTNPFFTSSARYVVDHVPNARVHDVPGVGHAAPLTDPDTLADALTEIFAQRSSRPDPPIVTGLACTERLCVHLEPEPVDDAVYR